MAGFQTYTRLQGVLDLIPPHLPGLIELEGIFADFRANYQVFESWHMRNRLQVLKLSLQEHSKKAFHVIRTKDLPSMEHLIRTETAEVLEVDRHQPLVHADRQFTVCSSSYWFLNDCPATVSRHGDHIFEVHCDLLLCPGQILEQRCHFVTTDELLQEVSSFWEHRWHRHLDLAEDSWHHILNFGRLFVAPVVIPHEPITVLQWNDINKRYTSTSARGPDGYGHQDLLRMPQSFKQSLVDLVNLVEQRGEATSLRLSILPG